jgi:serine phosphatase RsbU (regulator of sigma subunit)
MTEDISNQRSWLSHLRHELSTPINSIIGYSGLVLDELEDLSENTDIKITAELQNINTQGKHILSAIKTILSSDRIDGNYQKDDLDHWLHTLYGEIEGPVNKVITGCQQILEIVPSEFRPDIVKIHQSSHNLLTMLNQAINHEFSEFIIVNDLPKSSDILAEKQIINSPDATEYIDLPPEVITAKNILAQLQILDKKPENQKKVQQGKILIVDDKENNREILTRYIKEEGHTVDAAVNGLQAIHKIQAGKYDLILLDIIMPEMDGYQVLKWLHSSEWYYIPVVMISALDELDSVVKCIQMGAEDYLSKPFNPVLLRARIGASLEKKYLRDQETLYLGQLAQANQAIMSLNELLKAENLQMGAKLEVTRQLQQMILPREEELNAIKELEISGIMQPTEEVGGDYYDVLSHEGRIKIGIGDVTGHGLESSVLMLMLQTAVRTLIEANEQDPKRFLEILNRTLYKNVKRMNSRRQLTFSIIDYHNGKLRLSGQHEEMIVIRSGGKIERIDTGDLGLPIALTDSICEFVNEIHINLNYGDVVVLYTDGITEAENELGEQYSMERLCNIVSQNWQLSAHEIRQLAINDVLLHIGNGKVDDDITLVVFKKKITNNY